MQHEIYLVYAPGDADFAQEVCNAFERRGVRCWVDFRDMPSRGNPDDNIREAIRAATVVIVLRPLLVFGLDQSGDEIAAIEAAGTPVFTFPPEDIREIEVASVDVSSIGLGPEPTLDAFVEGMVGALRPLEAAAGPEPESERPARGARGERRMRGGGGRRARRKRGTRRMRGAAAPEPAAEREVDDRRLGVDVFLGDQKLENAFVADQENTLRVSIGHSAGTRVDAPVGIDFAPDVESRTLWMGLAFQDPLVLKEIVVEKSPSSEASVDFTVTPTGAAFSAVVVLYAEDKRTVIQAARLTGHVVADAAAQAQIDKTYSFDIVPVTALGAQMQSAEGSVVTDGESAEVHSNGVGLSASDAAAKALIQKFTKGLATAAANHVAAGAPIEKVLVAAARFGARMASDLAVIEQLEPLERIQVVSLTKDVIFPLEIVYGGATPKKEATLCADWQESLRQGRCAACADPAPGADPSMTVCPLEFWGMSKVIEHHVPPRSSGTGFEARVQRLGPASKLRSFGKTLVGASELVLAEGDDPLAPVRAIADALGDVDTADSWDEWKTKVGAVGPSVLVAMPHQGVDDDDPFDPHMLELAGDTESTFGEGFVRRAGEDPVGPVVLLIGCDVALAEDAISSFAGTFRSFAPVVVSAMGKVIASEAPKAAATVLTKLRDASARQGATFGEALRDARRALLADSLLVGLQLIGHGDSDWPVQGAA